MNNILFLFFKVLSWSPLFRISDDSRFNRVEKNSTKFRFSLFSFNMGIISLYFFTWDSTKKFKLFHRLSLYEAQNFHHNATTFENKYDEYLLELMDKEHININYEKEFLTQRISEIENLKNKTFNKFLAYVALFVFILPLYAPKLPNLFSFFNSFNFLYVIAMIYVIANLICLAIEFIKVRQVKRVTFSEVRNATEDAVDKKYTAMLFYEWKHHTNESTFEVALIRNVEKYMGILVLLSILIILSANIEKEIKESFKNNQVSSSQKRESIITLKLENKKNLNELIRENEIQIEDIKNKILKGKYKKVVVVSKSNNNLSSDLINLLELYKDESVSIIDIRKKEDPKNIEIILLKE